MKYGSIVLAGTTGLSTLMLNNSIRKLVHLRLGIGVSIALPIIVGSGFGVVILQEEVFNQLKLARHLIHLFLIFTVNHQRHSLDKNSMLSMCTR